MPENGKIMLSDYDDDEPMFGTVPKLFIFFAKYMKLLQSSIFENNKEYLTAW